jgi:hypothetical protein
MCDSSRLRRTRRGPHLPKCSRNGVPANLLLRHPPAPWRAVACCDGAWRCAYAPYGCGAPETKLAEYSAPSSPAGCSDLGIGYRESDVDQYQATSGHPPASPAHDCHCPVRGVWVLISFVSATALPSPADRFARIMEGLCRAVAAGGGNGGLTGVLVILLWGRLRRMAARFASVAARLRAGTLCAAAPRPRAAAPRARPRRPGTLRLSRGFASLLRQVPQASFAGSQLQHLLADPEMAVLLNAAPQLGRILRPLCRMLGVRPAPGAIPPPPPRPATAARTGDGAASAEPARPSAPLAPRAPARACRPPDGHHACGPPVPA